MAGNKALNDYLVVQAFIITWYKLRLLLNSNDNT